LYNKAKIQEAVMKAGEIHSKGFNCAQSVLLSLSDLTGLDEKKSLAIAGGFGGGMRAAEVCGAVSGAVMAIGLLFPFADGDDSGAKDRIAALTREFHRRFREKNETIICRSLLGYDMEKPEESAIIKEQGIIAKVCPGFMDCAEAIVRDLVKENKEK
jgi:C_GCAxxG_C_C family probable redox protein